MSPADNIALPVSSDIRQTLYLEGLLGICCWTTALLNSVAAEVSLQGDSLDAICC